MVKNSNPEKGEKKGNVVVFGREVVDMSIKVVPEVKARIEAFATQQNIDVDVAAGVIIEFAIAKKEALAQVAKEKVMEIFNEEVERFEHELEEFMFRDEFGNIKKKGPVN